MKKIRQRNLQLVLDTACEVSADCGFSTVRFSDVAERVGVAKTNMLYYYRSKAQLYKAILDSIVEPLLGTSRPFTGGQPPAEALRAYVDNKMRIGAERPYTAGVFSCEIMRGASRMPAALLERLDAWAGRNAEHTRQWIGGGLLVPLDPYHLLLNLWAMTESYAPDDWQLARLTGQVGLDMSDYRQATEDIVRLVCASCLALPGETAPRWHFRTLAGWATRARSISTQRYTPEAVANP